MAQTKEIVVQPNPAALLQIAVEGGADVDKLEKLMDMQERWEKNQAKKAYVVAMAKFKKTPLEILKDSHVEYEKKDGSITKYAHASLSNVCNVLCSELGKYGFAVNWKTSQADGGITVACIITHIEGHSEQTALTGQSDISGGKNAIQGIGSTVAYLERYTILALTGSTTKDMDTDGRPPNGKPEKLITKKQTTDINTSWGKKLDKAEFQRRLEKKYGTSKLETLTTEQADELLKALNIIPDKPKE